MLEMESLSFLHSVVLRRPAQPPRCSGRLSRRPAAAECVARFLHNSRFDCKLRTPGTLHDRHVAVLPAAQGVGSQASPRTRRLAWSGGIDGSVPMLDALNAVFSGQGRFFGSRAEASGPRVGVACHADLAGGRNVIACSTSALVVRTFHSFLCEVCHCLPAAFVRPTAQEKGQWAGSRHYRGFRSSDEDRKSFVPTMHSTRRRQKHIWQAAIVL